MCEYRARVRKYRAIFFSLNTGLFSLNIWLFCVNLGLFNERTIFEQKSLDLRKRALDLNKRATHTKVLGSQLVTMTLHDLMTDLELCKIHKYVLDILYAIYLYIHKIIYMHRCRGGSL